MTPTGESGADARVRVRVTVVLGTVAALLAGCSSPPKSGPTPSAPAGASASAGASAAGAAEVRQSLAAFEKPLGAEDAQRAWEGLAAAVGAASARGVDHDTISREVLLWESRRLSTPEGQQTFMANAAALNGRVVSVGGTSGVPAPTLGAPPAGGPGRPAAFRQASPGAGLSFYFVNGVLNNFDSSTVNANLLSTTLSGQLGYPVRVNLQFNASSASIAMYTYSACQEAQRATAGNPIQENRDLAKAVCGLSAAGAVVLPDAVMADVSGTITRKLADPDFALDGVNVNLLKNVQDDLGKGLRVVLISHSEGGLYLRNVLPRIGAGKPVGALYIAPPFGSGQELNANPTRYEMFEWDWLLMGVSSVDFTTRAVAPQIVYDGSTASRFNLHYLSNYLYCGSDSAKQAGDRTRELVDFVNSVPASRGGARPGLSGGDGLRPGQGVQGCPVPQPEQTPSETPTETPTETPSETPTETPTGTPSETPTEVTPSGSPSPSAGAYYVFLLTNVSGGNVLVGSLDDVQGKRTCDFADGGLCADAGGQDVPVQYTAELGPYPTLVDAQAAYCANATNPHPGPGAAGTKVDIFGGSYWTDNIGFGCPTPSP
ncbi:hypothetical protein ACGF13_30130 [Kitasatospora sp. NPDC048286]|uniref:hypothetical protein n=1 Tax=Kitasatospora sp. NPDC048286 TaxID=3364047 RepID=UPI00371D7C53